jgi:hypothetical protein
MVGERAKPVSMEKKSVAMVGLGNCGSTLAWALHQAGYPIAEMVVRHAPTPAQKKLARDCGARLVRWTDWRSSAAEVVWICVRDDEIAEVARAMAERFGGGSRSHPMDGETVHRMGHPNFRSDSRSHPDFRSDSRSHPNFAGKSSTKIYLHASAPRSFHELDPLKRTGAAIGSAHPVRSFPAAQRVPLTGTYFAIEGDAAARKAATAMAERMKAIPFTLRAKDKALYHAFCVLCSPLLIAHLAAAESLGVAAGVPKAIAPRLLATLGGGTFANWQRKGAAKSFSGPISRGDIETIALHLASLSRMSGEPETEAIYRALSEFGVQHLPARRRAQMAALLSVPKGKR